MSLSNYTRNILNIKDKNIIFEENFLNEEKINGSTTKVFHGKLTYTPSHCPKFGCVYDIEQDNIIKYGLKKSFYNRLMLHASKLVIIHPVTNETLLLESRLPKEFKSTI